MERLGVSNSEISRFERIHSSLIPALMTLFRAERIATNVAHEIAKLDESTQRYIFENWDSSNEQEMLAFPVMTKLVAQYQLSLSTTGQDVQPARQRTSHTSAAAFTTIAEGVSGVDQCYQSLFSQIRGAGKIADAKGERRVLRQINKIYSDLMTLQNEIDLYSATTTKNSKEG